MSNLVVIDAYLGAHHDTDLGDETLLEEETLHEYEAEAQAEEEQHQPHHGGADAAHDRKDSTS